MLKSAGVGILLFFLAAGLGSCKHIPYGDNPAAGKYYNIRGIKMYCEIYGDTNGKPLLLIHGNGGSVSTFKDVIPFFARKYKVIVADSRAQGRSNDAKDSLSFEMIADDYNQLLGQLHVDSANVFGWSDGGIVAILIAMRYPDKVAKLVASGPNLWPDSTALEPSEWKDIRHDYNELKDKPKITAKEREKWKCVLLDYYQPNITLSALKNIKCPSLIMGGDHDIIRQQHLKLISQNIPRANLWILNHSGHGTLFEHKYKFMYEVNRFFNIPFDKDNTF